MKRFFLFALVAVVMAFASCGNNEKCENQTEPTTMSSLQTSTVTATIDAVRAAYPDMDDAALMERGVRNAAAFWQESDGTAEQFTDFCVANYQPTAESRLRLFNKLQENISSIYGNYNQISIQLKKRIHEVDGDIETIDEMFGNLDPFCHFSDDMFGSKIAFITLLNFPSYTLDEKNTLGVDWTSTEWGYARLGDWFGARVPAAVAQNFADQTSMGDMYISNYNIVMGQLRNEQGERIFPDNMALITHWGLRDELKSNYANADGRGLEKQRMIYKVMTHIVDQTIPASVINNSTDVWYPYSNEVKSAEGELLDNTREADVRYQTLYNIYKAAVAMDKYNPTYPTYLQRSFHQAMEMTDQQIEDMFVAFMQSPEVAEVGKLIESRLGRKLEPFDIWYDGFKARGSINEEELSVLTRRLYPTTEAYAAALPGIMVKLGFTPAKAAEVCAKIDVDASRGAGHAWGAMADFDISHLRTRVAANGMDYKGYNIATHEFGHNVEQTITMNDVDNYFVAGVPSTAFTEALAFVFQTRDLELLGFANSDPNAEALAMLDIFWGSYEIMGVSLVDLYTWRWLYENPDATVEDLKATIIRNAEEVWNKYYAPIFGEENSHILAIYSHMIDIPLYLPNYPYGHLVQAQLEEYLRGKVLGEEVCRMYPVGKLTPNLWMRHAVGSEVSGEPLIHQAREALKVVK